MLYYPNRPLKNISPSCWHDGWRHPVVRMEVMRDAYGETDLTEGKFVGDYIESAEWHVEPTKEIEDAYMANTTMGIRDDGTPYTQINSRSNGRITLTRFPGGDFGLRLLDGSWGLDFGAPRVTKWHVESVADLIVLGLLQAEIHSVTADVVTPQMLDHALTWIHAKAPVKDGAHWAAMMMKKSFHTMG